MSAEVKNTGDGIMPFMLGGHPGFCIPMDEGLSLTDYVVDLGVPAVNIHRQMPNGYISAEQAEDYPLSFGCMKLSDEEIQRLKVAVFHGAASKVHLFSPKGSHRITMERSENFEFLGVWKAHNALANFICLEPWSGVPTAHSDFETRPTMKRLLPGEAEKFFFTITFE